MTLFCRVEANNFVLKIWDMGKKDLCNIEITLIIEIIRDFFFL